MVVQDAFVRTAHRRRHRLRRHGRALDIPDLVLVRSDGEENELRTR